MLVFVIAGRQHYSHLHHCLTNKYLLDEVNVVLLSDHGMTTVIPQRNYNLTQYVNKSFFEIDDSSPVLQIHPAEDIPLSVCCSNLYSTIYARKFCKYWKVPTRKQSYPMSIDSAYLCGIVQIAPVTMSLSTATVTEVSSLRNSTSASNLYSFRHFHIVARSAC